MDFPIYFFRDLISDGMKSGSGPVFGGLVGYTKAPIIFRGPLNPENLKMIFDDFLEKICWDQKFRRLKKKLYFSDRFRGSFM